MLEINGIQVPFIPAGGIRELGKNNVGIQNGQSKGSFKEIFTEECQKLKFSAHAQARIASRDVSVSENDLSRLEEAMQKGSEKSSKESLILLDDKAFIVSVPNKTVITVVPKSDMSNNVVTGIDSVVFA